jgi:GTP-binding protein
VGKSSVINCLTGRRNLARTSSTPGRTQIINFFSVDDFLMLVDLPGFGYARVPERVRAGWASMIEQYLDESLWLRLVIHIVDARHEPGALDRQMMQWLRARSLPFRVLVTKVDKVPRSRRVASLRAVAEALELTETLPFSAVTGEGKRELWKVLTDAVTSG